MQKHQRIHKYLIMIETSWNSSTHNLDMLHVPDKTILHKTVDRWRTFYPTITCSLKAYRIQMTWHKLSGMGAWLQGKDSLPWCSVPQIIGKLFLLHTTHTFRQLLQFRLLTSSSMADSSHPITHPRHIAPSWTWKHACVHPQATSPEPATGLKCPVRNS